MYGLPGGVGTQCNILAGSNTGAVLSLIEKKKQYYSALDFIGR